MLADVVEDHVPGNRSGTEQPRFAPFSLDLVFPGEGESTEDVEAGFSRFPAGICCKEFRHIRFRAAGLAGFEQCGCLAYHEVGRFQVGVGSGDGKLHSLILSDLVIGDILGLDYERSEHDNLVRYFADPDEALDVAVKESIDKENFLPLLFLMNNTHVQQVKRVADENLIMPHKSTYFYPKILTGLLLNKYNPDEKIGPE